ncbi:MAG: ATP synthase F1 subunit delta [Bacteroidota bacterium]
MRPTRVANRYAKSLLHLAIDKNAQDAVFADMNTISDAIVDSRELDLLLKSPVIKSDKKEDILQQIFDGKVSEISAEFIRILVRKKREGIIEVIADEYENLYKSYKNITVAEVTSASKLDEALRAEIMAVVKKMAKNEVELKEIIDPDIIGGFIVKVGDQQVDASVIRKLTEYRKTFSKNPYIAEF